MVRFRLSDAAEIADIVGKHDYFEANGDDVFCWDRKTRVEENQKVVVCSAYTEETWKQEISRHQHIVRELEDEVQDLQHRLRWTFFRPVYEWRLCQQINDLKTRIVEQLQDIEKMKQDERPTYERVETEKHQVTFYECVKVWHVNCEVRPTLDEGTAETVDELPAFDQINTSIIMALTEPRSDQRVKAVERFVVDCERNHKGRFKVFLDTSREGRQLKLIGCSFEDLLVV